MNYKKSSSDSSKSVNYAGSRRSNNTGGSKTNFKTSKLFNSNAVLVTNGSIKDYDFIYRTLVKNFQSLSDTFVVAADGGAMHCSNLKITPNVIIGDMDSITMGMIEKLGCAAGGKSGSAKGASGESNGAAADIISDSSITGCSRNSKASVSSSASVSSNASVSSSAGEIEFISFNQAKDESDTQLALDYLVKNGYERIIIIGAFGGRADHSFANLTLLSSSTYDNAKVSIITENSKIFIVKKSCTIKGEVGKKISIFSLTPFTFFEKTSGLKYKLKNEKLLFSPARGLSNEFVKDAVKINITEGWLLVIREL